MLKIKSNIDRWATTKLVRLNMIPMINMKIILTMKTVENDK